MSLSHNSEIEEEFLFPETATFAATESGESASAKRRYDPGLYLRGITLQKDLKAYLEKMTAVYLASHPEQQRDLNVSLDVKARAKSTPGAYKVTQALIELIVGPRGAELTQDKCRQEVQSRFPGFAVPKDWTKAMRPWEMAHAKKVAASAAGCTASVVVKAGMSLRDLHAAKKLLAARSNSEARTYRVEITFTDEAITIGGLQVKQTNNRSNGKEYAVARLNVSKLEQAVARKRSK